MYNNLKQKKPQKWKHFYYEFIVFDAKSTVFPAFARNYKEVKPSCTLRAAGARKLRGTPIKRMFGFLLSSIFANGSSFNQ